MTDPRALLRSVRLTFLAVGIFQSTWIARLPSISSDLGLTLDQVSLLLLAFGAGGLIGLVVAPVVVARIGPRGLLRVAAPVLVIGAICAAALAHLLEGTGGLMITVPVVVVFSTGFGVIDVTMNLAGAQAEQEIGRSVLPGLHALYSTGALGGSLLAIGAVALDAPPSLHLLTTGVLAFTMIVGASGAYPRTSERSVGVAFRTRATMTLREIATPRIAALVVLVFILASAEATGTNWTQFAVLDGHGLDEVSATVAYAGFFSATVLSRFIGGRIVDRIGRIRTLVAASGVAVAGVAVFVLLPDPGLIPGAFLWGLGVALAFPLGISAAAEGSAQGAMARVSAMSAAGYGANFIAPPIVGLLAAAFGPLTAVLTIGCVVLLALPLVRAARPLGHPPVR